MLLPVMWFRGEDHLFNFPQWCVMCKVAEIVIHLFLHCLIALVLWIRLSKETKMSWDPPVDSVGFRVLLGRCADCFSFYIKNSN